jgi:L-lactate dehydrogenase (cytochrome)
MAVNRVIPVTSLDYRRLSRKRLPGFLFDYIDGGAGDEESMAANRNDFSRHTLKQRVMRDVSSIDTTTVLSGAAVAMPLVLAPVGLAGMMGRRGEVQGARAAETCGIPFTTSTVGICSVEEVSESVEKPIWFQLYMLRDRTFVESMLERSQHAGCQTLVFTVDLAVTGLRHRDVRNGVMGGGATAALRKAWQLLTRPHWMLDVGIRGKPHDFGNLRDVVGGASDIDSFKNWIDRQFDSTVTWEDIAWLRSLWKGKLIIKGIMTADDARSAIDAGADGVVVSNHGGRQLEGVASSISKLPEVVAAIGEHAEVYMDGGVRSGTDVVKAVALGANGVMIGRPWVWAMSSRGQQGLVNLLGVFQQEIAVSMALMGVTRIEQITRDLIEA